MQPMLLVILSSFLTSTILIQHCLRRLLDAPGTTSEKRLIARTRFSNAGEETLNKIRLQKFWLCCKCKPPYMMVLQLCSYSATTLSITPQCPIRDLPQHFQKPCLGSTEICPQALLSLQDRMGLANGTVIENGINEVKQYSRSNYRAFQSHAASSRSPYGRSAQ